MWTEQAFGQNRHLDRTGIWSQCLDAPQSIPSPGQYGWKRVSFPINQNNVCWEPVWITNGEASTECREFLKCTCGGPCTRCKFANTILQCTLLYKCQCPNRFSFET